MCLYRFVLHRIALENLLLSVKSMNLKYNESLIDVTTDSNCFLVGLTVSRAATDIERNGRNETTSTTYAELRGNRDTISTLQMLEILIAR